jgi:hypothetical protein
MSADDWDKVVGWVCCVLFAVYLCLLYFGIGW